ncbi:MAG: septum formation initiator family protein [bacterium]
MRNFQQKSRLMKALESKPVLIILGIFILIFAWNVFGFWSRMEETSKNKKIIEDRVDALKVQKEKLASDINSLNTVEGKEKLFRENFGLAKEGENLIIVVDDKNQPEVPKTGFSSGFWSKLFFWRK